MLICQFIPSLPPVFPSDVVSTSDGSDESKAKDPEYETDHDSMKQDRTPVDNPDVVFMTAVMDTVMKSHPHGRLAIYT